MMSRELQGGQEICPKCLELEQHSKPMCLSSHVLQLQCFNVSIVACRVIPRIDTFFVIWLHFNIQPGATIGAQNWFSLFNVFCLFGCFHTYSSVDSNSGVKLIFCCIYIWFRSAFTLHFVKQCCTCHIVERDARLLLKTEGDSSDHDSFNLWKVHVYLDEYVYYFQFAAKVYKSPHNGLVFFGSIPIVQSARFHT